MKAQVSQLDNIMKEIQQESTTAQKMRIEAQMDLERMKQEIRMKNSLNQSRSLTWMQSSQQQFGQYGMPPMQPQFQQTAPNPVFARNYDERNNRPFSGAGFSIVKNQRNPVWVSKSVEIKNEL